MSRSLHLKISPEDRKRDREMEGGRREIKKKGGQGEKRGEREREREKEIEGIGREGRGVKGEREREREREREGASKTRCRGVHSVVTQHCTDTHVRQCNR
jgi:hypothetical protein